MITGVTKMEITKHIMWENIPSTNNSDTYLMQYEPDEKITGSTILIIPGSGYQCNPANAVQEGDRVAKYLCEKGIPVFMLEYRIAPDFFPLPILDGRRAMRYIRYYADKFGIDKNKIATIGYSAGGHLAASLVSFNDKIDFEDIDEIDNESYTPNFQVLSYPVISLDKDMPYTHQGSADHLLGERYEELKDKLSFEKVKIEKPIPTFLWHNFDDSCVDVSNTLLYAQNMKDSGGEVEIHIFPHGNHGVGLADWNTKESNHFNQWTELMIKWLRYVEFF